MNENKSEEVPKIQEPDPQAQAVVGDRRAPEAFPQAPAVDEGNLSGSVAEVAADSVDSHQPVIAEMPDSDKAVVAEMRKKTRRSFIVGGAAALTALGGWRWLRTRREVDGLAWPLRLSHEFNEQLSRDYFSSKRLTPNFPREMASEPRVNGGQGLDEEDFDPAKWKLAIVGLANPPEPVAKKPSASAEEPNAKSSSNGSEPDETDTESVDNTDSREPDLRLKLDEIKQLPRVEMVTQLKCIEGWSVIVHWAGARLAALIAKYPPSTRSGDDPDVARHPDDLVGYVGLETPDSEYFVGLDMESALHPQTLLCYEMNGKPLSLQHGAPLRLVIPVKYGIKNIKRIGKITYTDKRPADYWAERGYDWYSGH